MFRSSCLVFCHNIKMCSISADGVSARYDLGVSAVVMTLPGE